MQPPPSTVRYRNGTRMSGPGHSDDLGPTDLGWAGLCGFSTPPIPRVGGDGCMLSLRNLVASKRVGWGYYGYIPYILHHAHF